ncbi:MAG: lipid-A-disaccharide synthase [Candidatus Omnitrophica bacterium]|nr:lipid-A-disaccharide synthase [Candidatus Omnitrophota bacterium]
MPKKIVIIAGESSGDLHAAHLINALKERSHNIEIGGLGGRLMKNAGAEIYYDLTSIAVIGFLEVIKNLRKFKYAFKLILEKIDQIKPDAVILVDYPGFNLKIAKELKKRKIPIIYYISPQIWAWGKKRVKLIENLIDRMIVIFKFEEEFYKKEGITVFFTGHPLIETTKPSDFRQVIITNNHLDDSRPIITLLPGSRENEVRKVLPIMLNTASLLYKKNKDLQFLIIRSPSIDEKVYGEILKVNKLPARLLVNNVYNLLSISDFALVCSGTATLEAAILQVPMVVIYKVTFLSWLFIKSLIKIPYIGLVNIAAGKKIVPEFIQYDTHPREIAGFVASTLADENKLEQIKKELFEVKKLLGTTGASKRAAEYIIDFLNGN